MITQTLAQSAPPVKTPLPKTAAERVREMASIHRAVCRHCKPNGSGMVCSIGFGLLGAANRLEQKDAEMAARALVVEVARGHR